MNWGNFTNGVAVLGKYAKSDQFCIGAEHDEFRIWVEPEKVSAEDRATLEQLGWLPEEDNGWLCFT